MKKQGTAGLAICLMVAAAAAAMTTDGTPCLVTELSPCAGLLLTPGTSAAKPSQECCSRLKEQEPCLCSYIKDPIIGPYINAVNTRTVSATCGVPVPTC